MCAVRNVTEGVTAWTFRMPFPKDRYTLTCIEEEFGMSKSSGNPMITRTWEISSPELVTLGERQINVAGQKIMQYITTKVKNPETGKWDEVKSDKSFGQLSADLKMLGYENDSIDDENPPLIAQGKSVDAIIYAKKQQSFQSPSAEDVKSGKKVGAPIKDGSGKDVVTYQLAIEQILGLAS